MNKRWQYGPHVSPKSLRAVPYGIAFYPEMSRSNSETWLSIKYNTPYGWVIKTENSFDYSPYGLSTSYGPERDFCASWFIYSNPVSLVRK